MRIFIVILVIICTPFLAYAAGDVWNLIENKKYSKAVVVARALGEKALLDYARWQEVIHADVKTSFSELHALLARRPDWSQANIVQTRAEAALLDEMLHGSQLYTGKLKQWFASYPPISGRGKIALLIAVNNSHPNVQQLVQEAWEQGDFNADEERYILVNYQNYITPQLHLKRLQRLLWEDKTRGAERMLGFVSTDQKKLAKARIALIRRARNVDASVRVVPASLRNDAGLIFDRLRWRHKKRLYSGAVEMLNKAPVQVPYPEKWWPFRAYYAREFIEARQYKKAEGLLQSHGQVSGAPMAEARWMLGWVQLEYLNKAKHALAEFSYMYRNVSTPVSLARAAYWAGRASERMNDNTGMANWYRLAMQHPTTFYGQLATQELQSGGAIQLPSVVYKSIKLLNKYDIIRDIESLYSIGAVQIADKLLIHFSKQYKTTDIVSQAAKFAQEKQRVHAGVKIAKQALRKHIILSDAGWPVLRLVNSGVSDALAHAVARQESEMKHDAVSSAGARGLMQLLPSTARKVARNLGINYSGGKLDDIAYNSQLGTAYLMQLLEQYNGSHILAIAAYNAGPGNVNKWIKRFGYPSQTLYGAINWMETIPFKETRNYVQRVLENMQVYKKRLNKNAIVNIKETVTLN